jgi:tetraprenyl-beta-curcumene synthase
MALTALAVANGRYWPTVAPETRRELARWAGPAQAISDATLRSLALEKLRDERFNSEVAATLATLAPRGQRAAAVKAIVALELLFDYLDGCTELPSADPLGESRRLFAPFVGTFAPREPADGGGNAEGTTGYTEPGGSYAGALADRTRVQLLALPRADAVLEVAHASLQRCAEAQTRLHAAPSLGDRQLQDWAAEHAVGSGLEWRGYAGGCASSVLAAHALIAAAADPTTTTADARQIDSAYLAIGAVITILDSVVDESADRARGESGFIRLFSSTEELAASLRTLIREALTRCRRAPHGEHHAMTLAGVAAYYTTHPGAREPVARPVASMVRRELSPTISSTLSVVAGWGDAKRARRLTCHRQDLG